MKNILLYFGSFNPVHQGHISLAEYAVKHNLADQVVLIVSPQNPFKPAETLAPEIDRFEMAEIACANSRYPDRIKPSAIEFLLEKPSYTIQTLRYLEQNHGSETRFSLLMGTDTVNQLDRWKDADQIVGHYNIYVYPRGTAEVEKFSDQVVYLANAPLSDLSSTRVREAAQQGDDLTALVGSGVAAYIRDKGLWSPEARLAELTTRIDTEEPRSALYVARGRLYYRRAEWGKALNDFRAALRLDPTHREAKEYVDMVEEILAFRYKDIYNP